MTTADESKSDPTNPSSEPAVSTLAIPFTTVSPVDPAPPAAPVIPVTLGTPQEPATAAPVHPLSGTAPTVSSEMVMQAALAYRKRGWAITPDEYRGKKALLVDWPNVILTETDIPFQFGGELRNISVLLGQPSGGLVDVDLDSMIALRLADLFLPATGCVFGRTGKPRSHRLYRTGDIAGRKFSDPDNEQSCLVEIRSTRLKTTFPPSCHESGQPISWDQNEEPVLVDGASLTMLVARLATAVLFANHWQKGGRQDAAMALAGGLLRSGWEPAAVKTFIRAVATGAKDEETEQRVGVVEFTKQKLDRNEPVTGWPSLMQILGQNVVDRGLNWLQVGPVPPLSPAAAAESPLLATSSATLKVISVTQLLATIYQVNDEILKGILPAGSKAIASGVAKVGKTRFATGLCIGIAAGFDVMGFKVPKPRKVLYFQAEVSEHNMQSRFQALLGNFQGDRNLVGSNLMLCNDKCLKITDAHGLKEIRDSIKQQKPEVVAFDPLYKYHTGDENSVKDMTRLFDSIDSLIADYGVSVIIVHHHGKGKGNGGSTSAHLNRGSSAIADWADSLLTLTWAESRKEIVKLGFTLRNADEPEARAFQRNPVTLWFDPLPDYKFHRSKWHSHPPTAPPFTPATPPTSSTQSKAKVSSADVQKALGSPLLYGDLVRKLTTNHRIGQRTAQMAIHRALKKDKVIEKDAAGTYRNRQ